MANKAPYRMKKEQEQSLVDGDYLLEKFPGKGGWTFAVIPQIAQDPHSHFGWVQVKGSIDGYPLAKYKLMPMGNGKLFLPVKAAIRKVIKKEAGDLVRIILFADPVPKEVTDEFMQCLKDDPNALNSFNRLPDAEKKDYLNHIYSAKTEEDKVERMAKVIRDLSGMHIKV